MSLLMPNTACLLCVYVYCACTQETVLIGDTPDDIAAVIAAGGRGIGVRTPLDQAHVSFLNAQTNTS
jgi:phosphoglycolate phosphatase-like HAD superfamily hydrolase